MKILVNIPGFGERYCSNDIEYKLFNNGEYYVFYKKGTYIKHNEYGPAFENKSGNYVYCINNKYHRLNDYVCYYSVTNYNSYEVIGVELGETKEEFIKNLANTLIPK